MPRRAARRFLKTIIGFMPPDVKPEARRIFELGHKLGHLEGGKGDNDIAVFIALIRHARSDWEGAAKVLEEGP